MQRNEEISLMAYSVTASKGTYMSIRVYWEALYCIVELRALLKRFGKSNGRYFVSVPQKPHVVDV